MTTPQPRRGGSKALRAVLAAVAVCLSLGLLLGVAWWLVAPTPLVVVRDGAAFLANPESSAFIAADGWFAVLGILAGLLSADLVFRPYRQRGVAALIAGGVLASVVAWRLGHLLGPDELAARAGAAADGMTIEGPLQLRALGVLLAWPIAAVSVFLSLLVGFEPRPRAEAKADPGRQHSSVGPGG
jgi:hypothetical protein